MRSSVAKPAAALLVSLLAACGAATSSSDGLSPSASTPHSDAGSATADAGSGGGGTGTGGGADAGSGTGAGGGGGTTTGGGTVSGTSTCGDIVTCMNNCANGDTACEQTCVDGGSSAGQSQFGALNSCLNTNCASAQTQAAFDTCANQSCASEIQGCDGLSGGGSTGSLNTAVICQACSANADCGTGNFCVQSHCAAGPCTSSAQCGAGNSCFNLQNSAGQTTGTACYPTSQACSGSTPPVDAGTSTRDAGAAACTTDTYANYAKSFFQQNCDGCHGHAFGNSFSTFNASKSSVQSRINSGSMPPSGLASATKTRILKWISCGAPQ